MIVVSQGSPTIITVTSPTSNVPIQISGSILVRGADGLSVSFRNSEQTATAGQVIFLLPENPIGDVAMSINGFEIPKASYAKDLAILNRVNYDQAGNSDSPIEAGDRINFNYIYAL